MLNCNSNTFNAAKSSATMVVADVCTSNKWFCNVSGMCVSNFDGGSLNALRNIESIPPAFWLKKD